MATKQVRTRIAPSPTGYPHIGTIYQALFDKAYALKNNGKFIMRIEDTDQTRLVEDAEDALYKAFDWFGLTPDESPKHAGEFGPYKQSERLEIYQKYANQLIDSGHAYYCFCSKERLEQVREQQQKEGKTSMYDKHCRNLPMDEIMEKYNSGMAKVIRMKVPENEKIIVKDLIRGDIEFDSNLVDDQVIMKSDGFPTYHLAVVVDDILMEISHVVRGPEWITSFPKHKLLYDFFGWQMPEFAHTPMITNMDGSKLSKRNGHSSVDWYKKRGFLPEAVINFISLLGWSHPDQKEIFSFEEFVSVFDLKDMSAVSPKFDITKLEWMNGQYIQAASNEELLEKLNSWLGFCINEKYQGAAAYESHWIEEDYIKFSDFLANLSFEDQLLFIEINKERIKKFEDLLPMNRLFLYDEVTDMNLLKGSRTESETKDHLTWFYTELENVKWNLADIKDLEIKVKNKAEELGWKIGEVFAPIRIAVAASKVSPPLFESIYLLGRDKALNSISRFIK
jgi:glutamyl-tRNA synthetase